MPRLLIAISYTWNGFEEWIEMGMLCCYVIRYIHDDVIKWKHFPRYWPFVRGIHRLPVNSPHRGQWRRALMFSLICAWTKSWLNNRDTSDLRRHSAHYDVTVMKHPMWPAAAILSNDIIHSREAYISAHHDCMLFKNPTSHWTVKHRQRCWLKRVIKLISNMLF